MLVALITSRGESAVFLCSDTLSLPSLRVLCRSWLLACIANLSLLKEAQKVGREKDLS
jgi:hypothetical protein